MKAAGASENAINEEWLPRVVEVGHRLAESPFGITNSNSCVPVTT